MKTIKMIMDVPKDLYAMWMARGIKLGTLLNEVLDEIRAEIEKLRPNLRPEQMTDYDYAMVDVVNDIVAIIDKYNERLELQEKEEQMDTPICYCGTVMEIEKKRYSGGMGECYDDWILSCPKCGIKKTYPADNFYGRDFISDEKTVIDTWNDMRRENR